MWILLRPLAFVSTGFSPSSVRLWLACVKPFLEPEVVSLAAASFSTRVRLRVGVFPFSADVERIQSMAITVCRKG